MKNTFAIFFFLVVVALPSSSYGTNFFNKLSDLYRTGTAPDLKEIAGYTWVGGYTTHTNPMVIDQTAFLTYLHNSNPVLGDILYGMAMTAPESYFQLPLAAFDKAIEPSRQMMRNKYRPLGLRPFSKNVETDALEAIMPGYITPHAAPETDEYSFEQLYQLRKIPCEGSGETCLVFRIVCHQITPVPPNFFEYSGLTQCAEGLKIGDVDRYNYFYRKTDR